jgi:hypothetical protein
VKPGTRHLKLIIAMKMKNRIKRKIVGKGISNFRFQISDFTSHIQTTNQHTLRFYAPTQINHKKVWTQWKTKVIYSEVELLVRLFNAMKSKM